MTGAAAALVAGVGLLVYPPPRRRVPGIARVPTMARLPAAARLPVLAGLAGTACGYLVSGAICAMVGALVAVAGVVVVRRRTATRAGAVPPLRLAASWELLAACLRGGLAVPHAITLIAGDLPGAVAGALRETADLIALGAPPAEAWRPALALPATEALGVGAVRSARSGAALADLATTLAGRLRDQAADAADALAQRAGVLVTGPLGLCFLPAFLCLGVVPVVIGLVQGMVGRWP